VQVPEIVVHHLHEEQPAHEDEHKPEDREPFAQEVPVEGVQQGERKQAPAP